MIACVTLSFLSLGFARGQSTPVARYDFENASALGQDSSSSGATHDGVVNGSPTLDSGEFIIGSSSIRMQGDQNQYIEVSDHSELDATDQLTVAFWAKPTQMGVDGNARGIVSKRAGYNNNVSYSLFLPNSGGDLRIYLDEGVNAPNSIPTGYTFQTSWQHVAMVFDGTLSASERVKLYVNGALFGTYFHSAGQIRDLGGPLTIGSLNPDYDAGGSSYVSYDGWLDDIQIHRAALSGPEVAGLHAEGDPTGDGPVAYYDFENGSDLGVDTSGNGAVHDGSVNGTPSQDADAVVGSSSIRMFGDQNQYIEIPDHSELDATTGLTVAFWAKPTATGIDSNARGIVSKRAGYNDNVSYSLFLPNGSNGAELTLYLDDGDSQPHILATGYDLHTDWQHVALVYDGSQPSSDRVTLYVDGEAFGTYAHSAGQIRDLSGPVTLGALNPNYNPGGGYVSYDGWLDGIRIYRRPLSASEVSGLYGITPAAHWDFDDGSGSTAMDLSANALDISLQGSYTWTDGQVGGALNLGGQSTDYGTLADPDELENTDKFSLAFWVKPENLDGSARFVVSKRNGYTSSNAFSAFFGSGNRLFVEIDNNNRNNANRYTSATQFSNDTWYHVAAVYDGTLPESQRLNVYIDGDLDGNSPKAITSASIPNQPSDFYLGIANSGYATTFGGDIDDLLIYRAALTELEVEDLVERGEDNPPTGSPIFSEDFDDQPDWSPADNGPDSTYFTWDGADLPSGWTSLYNARNFLPVNENLRIWASDSADAYGGTGKGLKCFRENYLVEGNSKSWDSNGVLGVLMDEGHDEVYVEFMIQFQPGWTYDAGVNTSSKMFRIFSSTGQTNEFWKAFGGGEQGPLFLWGWSESSTYGLRNKLSFRGGPHGENYQMSSPQHVSGLGRGLGGLGDSSMNWTSDLQGTLEGGGTPVIPDKLNGGTLPASGAVSHPQVFGSGWTKLGFYFKMNSAPGVQDGEFRQYLNDELIVDSTTIMWVGPTSSPMPKWNAFSFGGNDHWSGGLWTNEDEREEWYMIDEIKVFDRLPQALQEN